MYDTSRIDQRSEEWYMARLGNVTASRVSDVMSVTKSGTSASRKSYMLELLCQRLTCKADDGYASAAMRRGVDLEPIARSAYEIDQGVMTVETGLVMHQSGIAFGASPDGLVGDDGLLEIKCPNTSTHVDFLLSCNPNKEYIWQMQAQMACTGRQWCDFVSFDDRLHDELQYRRVRVMRDDDKISKMISEIVIFLKELDELEDSIIWGVDDGK